MVAVDAEPDEATGEEQSRDTSSAEDRLWLIQCKRERSITPGKMRDYAKEVARAPLYGLIFAAPCNFSKKARDAFLTVVRREHVQEAHLWGRAELEDMLFQPKNDHLLFAYFGLSFVIRRRSLQTQIRSKLSMKRKAIRILGDIQRQHFKEILIRDANDTSYPYKHKDFDKQPNWFHSVFTGHYYGGIMCVLKRHFAYLGDDHKKWDFVADFNDVGPSSEDPWRTEEQRRQERARRGSIWSFWNSLPEKNRGWLEVIWLVAYESIVEIDGEGDEMVGHPHVYVAFDPVDRTFNTLACLEANQGAKLYNPEREDRVELFPKEFPLPKGSDD